MASERPDDIPTEASETPKLKRGKGLRLSVSQPPPDEIPATPTSAPEPPAPSARRSKGGQRSALPEPAPESPARTKRPTRKNAPTPPVELPVTVEMPPPLDPPPAFVATDAAVVDIMAPAESESEAIAQKPDVPETADVVVLVEPTPEIVAQESDSSGVVDIVAPVDVVNEVLEQASDAPAPASEEPVSPPVEVAPTADAPTQAVEEVPPFHVPPAATPPVDHGPVVVRQIVVGGHPYTLRQVGAGSPLLMLHGWGGSSQMWLPIMQELGEIHACYAPDLPGFGATPPFSPPADLEQLGHALLTFADALGIERFDLMGHSYGSAVATWIASHYPQRVNRLVLISFGVRKLDPTRPALTMARGPLNLALGVSQPWLTLWRPWVTALMTAPLMPQILGSWLTGHVPENDELFRASLADVMRADPRSQLASIVATGDPSLLDLLTRVAAPTLLVSGEEDRLFPQDAIRTAYEQIRLGRLVTIKSCGHLPTIEQTQVLLDELRGFLS